MLKVEDIKKIFDKIEVGGFGFENGNLIHNGQPYKIIDFMGWSIGKSDKWVHTIYPLFLQRVQQGINKSKKIHYSINISFHVYTVMKTFTNRFIECDDYPLNDQGLEQAIKYILDQME